MEYTRSRHRGKADGDAEVAPRTIYELEEYFLHLVGIDPTTYYSDTVRNNNNRAKAWENQESESWKKTRLIAFTVADNTFAGMNGTKVNKRLKKPEDMFKLPTDPKSNSKVLSGDAANEFMKQIVKK